MRRFAVALFSALWIFGAAWAAPVGGSLTLDEAISIAVEQNPTMRAAESEVTAAKANEKGARALTNPELEVAPNVAGEGGSDTAVLLVQPLEINGQRKVRGAIAGAETTASEAAYQSIRREVVRSVKQAYWEVVRARDIVELSRQNLELVDSLHQAAQRQLDVGAAPGSQVLKSQVELARARQELANAETELSQAEYALNTLLGRAADTPVEPADEPTFTPVSLDALTVRSIAEEKRPEMAEANALLSARQGEIRAAKLRRVPDLSIQARQESFGGEGGLAVGISLPVLDWGSASADRKRAEAEAQAQERRIEAVRNAIRLDVDSALREASRLQEFVREYEGGIVSQAEQLAEMAQKGYKAGATGYLEVLEAQRTLKSVRAEYRTALAEYRKALAQIEWAAGAELADLTAKEVEQ